MKKISPFFEKDYWVILITLVFVIVNAGFIMNGYYYLLALPLCLFAVYLAFISLDKLFYLMIFFVPVSIPLQAYMPELSFNVQLPTDPILVLILGIIIFKLIHEKKFDKRILIHPISLAIYFNLTWIFITALTSTMPVVSFKFLISRIWFIVSFYFLATQVFRTKSGIRRFIWAYVPLMMVVIIIVFVKMAQHGIFNQQFAHQAASPFFNDHTAYGSVIAMLFPFALGFTLIRKFSLPTRILSWSLVVVFSVALLLSYCRAAWISILVAGAVFGIIAFRIKFRTILAIFVIAVVFFFQNQSEFFLYLKQNTQSSSKDITKHIESISNIETDISNLERINRWKSAIRMFVARPIFGWGPGTYSFNYAPFQMSYDRTPISTNLGDRGNAHSDYIGALAESGFLGCLSFILLFAASLYTSVKVYSKLLPDQRQTKILLMCAILGLITYFTHASLNNFLDTDKDSSLFWGYMAIIVAIDIYQVKIKKPECQAS